MKKVIAIAAIVMSAQAFSKNAAVDANRVAKALKDAAITIVVHE